MVNGSDHQNLSSIAFSFLSVAMLCISQIMLSDFYPHAIFTTAIKNCHFPSWMYNQGSYLSRRHKYSAPLSVVHLTLVASEIEARNDVKEETIIKWQDTGSDVTEAQKQAISELPLKMTNRRKALMKRIICFSPEEENLSLLLASWVKVMKPRRADWLSVLKEMTRSESPLLFEVMEFALLEDSFEANVRDYTKLIDIYAKHNHIEHAENALQVMTSRGFPCDQVTMTVLINMYSKAGNLNRAKDTFEEIQLLGLPLDKRAYGAMIMAYIRAGMLNLAENLMKEMETKEIYAGREVYKALLRAYSTVGDADGAQRVFDAIQFARIVPDNKICALLMNAYCVGGDSDKALSVFENMRSVGLKPNDKCIALVLGAYERENNLAKAMAFLKDLEDNGVTIDQEASEVVERWFQRLGVVDDELQHDLKRLTLKQGRLRV